jgi:hypothetical protein
MSPDFVLNKHIKEILTECLSPYYRFTYLQSDTRPSAMPANRLSGQTHCCILFA